ncbi:hypothetical protein V2I52_10705 [Brenneria sp. g21c3]|nr:hypothetical protein [Brenneria sp. g21c3]
MYNTSFDMPECGYSQSGILRHAAMALADVRGFIATETGLKS